MLRMTEREYYHYEVSNFVDVSERLRELNKRLNELEGQENIQYEDFDIIISELIKRQNRIFRAIARELRTLRKQLERGDKQK